MRETIQLGPSCDLDENGDPKPVKFVREKLYPDKPFVRYIGQRKRRPRKGR